MRLELSGKNVLITGGAGFIGSHLSEELLEMGCSVVALDNFDDFYVGKERNLRALLANGRFHLIRGNILDTDALSSAMKNVDVVFHEAAQAGVGFSIENPIKSNLANVTGTLNVLCEARNKGVKRVVNASSSSVYGEPRYLPMDERHPTLPNSPYGVSKLAAEDYCRVFQRVYGLPVVSLRYFSVYGPRGRPDQVVHRFAQRVSEGKPPIIDGDGSHTRDFTYISDVVSAAILAAETEDADGQALNVGYGERTSIRQVAEMVVRMMGADKKLLEFVYADEKKGDFPHTHANNEAAKKLLKWEPRVNFREGLALFLRWFSEREAGNESHGAV